MNNGSRLKQRFELIAQSANQYPVDFDDAWQWVGYSTKQKGLNMLTANFEEGLDYISLNLTVKREIGATQKQQVNLTVDCFKSFCMMAGTERGKEVRRYYLAVEKALFSRERQMAAIPSEVKQIENFLNGFGLNIRLVPVENIRR